MSNDFVSRERRLLRNPVFRFIEERSRTLESYLTFESAKICPVCKAHIEFVNGIDIVQHYRPLDPLYKRQHRYHSVIIYQAIYWGWECGEMYEKPWTEWKSSIPEMEYYAKWMKGEATRYGYGGWLKNICWEQIPVARLLQFVGHHVWHEKNADMIQKYRSNQRSLMSTSHQVSELARWLRLHQQDDAGGVIVATRKCRCCNARKQLDLTNFAISRERKDSKRFLQNRGILSQPKLYPYVLGKVCRECHNKDIAAHNWLKKHGFMAETITPEAMKFARNMVQLKYLKSGRHHGSSNVNVRGKQCQAQENHEGRL